MIFVANQGRIYANFFDILDFKVCLWEVLLNAINFDWFCCFGRFIFFDFVNVENDAVCFASCLFWLLSCFFCCWGDWFLFGLGLGILFCWLASFLVALLSIWWWWLFLKDCSWNQILKRTDVTLLILLGDLALMSLYRLKLNLAGGGLLLHFKIGF